MARLPGLGAESTHESPLNFQSRLGRFVASGGREREGGTLLGVLWEVQGKSEESGEERGEK